MAWFCCFFRRMTAYERRISDWSSDVCSSYLLRRHSSSREVNGLAPAGPCLFFERLEIARERIARAFGQRDEDAAAVMRRGLAHEKNRDGHRLDPAQRRSRRSEGGSVGKGGERPVNIQGGAVSEKKKKKR